jgi:hypothetical protein
MARYRKKKALYEVMTKTKPGHGGAVDKLGPQESGRADTTVEKSDAPEWVSRWRKKPRTVQFVGGRIEFSIPYPLAIALLLGIVLVVLLAFRAGEYSGRSQQGLAGGTPKPAGRHDGATVAPKGKEPDPTSGPSEMPIGAQGNHRIVIQQFDKRRDLEEVQRYFLRGYGIETIIEQRGAQFFLLTKNTYDNPNREGTDGEKILLHIKQIGAGYEAQPGYESFAPRLFSDAYGERIK